jgi:tRNA-splicing ligase RtcB (3'-phosphate/5'-hydroxy nucleic acid ligase)
MDKPLTVFGDHEQKTIDQIEKVLEDDRAVAGALCADGHLGYSMPIGGVVAYKDAISPSGIGFDIACGNKAVRTEMKAADLGDMKPWMRMIQKNISFGLGRSNPEPVDHEVFDYGVWHEIDPEKGSPLKQKARQQLGTVGSGNHYVDLLVDEEGNLWIANHFGSRGLGHTIATMGLRWAYGLGPEDKKVERDEPAVLDLDKDAGRLYLDAMELAGDYAYAGRDYVIDQVLGLLGRPEVTFEVHNHHNYAWKEDGLWVVRKGATPLTPSPAFIGGSMGDVSVIVRGTLDITNPNEPTGWVEDIGALGSAPHGAGRVMSRTQAAGKLRKLWYCNNQNCKFVPLHVPGNAMTPFPKNHCPECGLPLRKSRRMRDASTAAVDWKAVREDLTKRGIVVLGSGADEAPEVYKDLMSVLGHHKNIEVLHTLEPLGVVMAGNDTHDPYKD